MIKICLHLIHFNRYQTELQHDLGSSWYSAGLLWSGEIRMQLKLLSLQAMKGALRH